MSHNSHEVIIVGAGLAGLGLARALQARGTGVALLEKSRGVGGRCATRRVDGQPVDHGLPLLHGRQSPFTAAVEQLQGLVPDWPFHVEGPGTPCQPQGHDSRSRRWAVSDGVNALPRALAEGLGVERETRVTGLATDGARLRLTAEDGAERSAATVVVTCPVPQALELLTPLCEEAGEELRGVLALLERVHMVASLVVMAGYERPTATDWHLRLPGAGSEIHSLLNDSSKRGQGARQVLVIQGRPSYSRREIDGDQERWSAALMEAAARELGQWALAPAWVQSHRWRHARVQRGDELSHPVLLRLPGGATLGLCGEAFNPRGGAEGAYLSGLELAERLLSGTATSNGIPEQGE